MAILLDAVYLLAAVLTAPFWLRKRRSGWAERFGRSAPLPPPEEGKPRVLLHAVSVGEVNLLRALVAQLAQSVDVVVSVTTDTGIARARELFSSAEPPVRVVRYPLDVSWAVRRFLDGVRPDAVGLVELELWPNFASACRRRGIPVGVLNARLSDRSFGRYRLARPLIGRWFGRLAFVAAQDDEYARRFIAVGVRADRVSVTGSMKWDAAPIETRVEGADDLAARLGVDPDRALIVGGSTAPDEHTLLHAACPEGAQLLCAPRRPEWWDDASRDLSAGGTACVRWSESNARKQGVDRFVLDTIGQLRKAYSLADVVVIGRSFGELYGSDPMEPAALGKPLVIGPSFADFRASVEALRDAGALVVTTRDGLRALLLDLLGNEARRDRMSAAARACVRAHQGATRRNADLLLSLLRSVDRT